MVFLATDLDREGEAIAWHVAEAAHVSSDKTAAGDVQRDHRIGHPRRVRESAPDRHGPRRRAADASHRRPARRLHPQPAPRHARSAAAFRPGGSNRSPSGWWSSANARSGHSRRGSTGPSRRSWRPPPVTRFAAELVRIDGEALDIPDEAASDAHAAAIRDLHPVVTKLGTRTQKRSPAAPFTTSTLQQEASRRLGFSPKRTMSVAQRLYEGIETPRGPGRPDHLHANRLHRHRRRGHGRGARGHRRALRRDLHDAQGPRLQDEVQGRPGSTRVDPADQLPARPGCDGRIVEVRRGCASTA